MFTSCAQYRYEYIDRHQVSEIEKLYLLGVNIDSTPSTEQDNDVVFYSTLFINDDFLDSFIDQFNRTYSHMVITTMESEKISEIEESLIRNKVKLGFYRENPIPEMVKGRWIKEIDRLLGGDGYATIDINTSVWKQDAQGFFKVYNSDGKVIWREQIDDFSPYIVYDQNSPYLIRNKQIKKKSKTESYYEELKHVYQILGSHLALEFLETL